MDLKILFFNSAGRLRSGWRLLFFFVVYWLLYTLLSILGHLGATAATHALGPELGGYAKNFIFRFILLFAALGAGYFCTRLLEGLPWRALGLWFHARWFRDFLVGSAIGVASLTIATAIATAGGGLTFQFSGRDALLQVGQTLVFSAVLFVLAALAEEALFRGYPLQTFTRAGLALLAVLLTSVPFAAVHLRNPNVAAGFTFINTSLAGVWFAVAYLRTRSLWLPLGLHWAWNWALGALFGLPVSGITDLAPYPLLHGIDLGPAWLTGGSYGIEGGVACTITLIVSTVFVWRTRLVAATPEMQRLTSQENQLTVER
jgi:membrane protease YdiL (CAAX protease family)